MGVKYAIERRAWGGMNEAQKVMVANPDPDAGWEGAGSPVFDTVAEAKALLHKVQVGALAEYRMVEVGRAGDLYRDAVKHGEDQCPAGEVVGYVTDTTDDRIDGRGYWTARYAARGAAGALLKEAKRVGVTEAQWEALRAVAADVAYD